MIKEHDEKVKETYNPKGIRFLDKLSGKEMLLIQDKDSGFDGWVAFKHPDGQWVSLRKATDEDKKKIIDEISSNSLSQEELLQRIGILNRLHFKARCEVEELNKKISTLRTQLSEAKEKIKELEDQLYKG